MGIQRHLTSLVLLIAVPSVLVGACRSSPVTTEEVQHRVATDTCTLDPEGQPVCTICLLSEPDPPWDDGSDGSMLDWDGAGGGGGGGGGAGGVLDEDWGWIPDLDDFGGGGCGGGGGGAGGLDGGVAGSGSAGAGMGGYDAGSGSAGAGMGGYDAGSGSAGAGMGGFDAGSGGAWNTSGSGMGGLWNTGGPGTGGVAGSTMSTSSVTDTGTFTDTGDAGAGAGDPGYTPQAGGAPVCVQKTWADVWGEWCDLRRADVQAWCRADEGSGPPQNVKNVIGPDFGFACCQFSWSGNNWTRQQGYRRSNLNCTDPTKGWCETVPRPAWADHVTDAQWASMGFIQATYFMSCYNQMRAWQGALNGDGSRAAVAAVCETFSRTGCKGLDRMIARLSAVPNPTHMQKRLLEANLAIYAAVCAGNN